MINGEGWLKDGMKCSLTIIEMKNYDHLDYILKPTENFLIKHNSFTSYHQVIVVFFRDLIKETNKGEIKGKFKELSATLLKIENAEDKKLTFRLFNFREWADQKERNMD